MNNPSYVEFDQLDPTKLGKIFFRFFLVIFSWFFPRKFFLKMTLDSGQPSQHIVEIQPQSKVNENF